MLSSIKIISSVFQYNAFIISWCKDRFKIFFRIFNKSVNRVCYGYRVGTVANQIGCMGVHKTIVLFAVCSCPGFNVTALNHTYSNPYHNRVAFIDKFVQFLRGRTCNVYGFQFAARVFKIVFCRRYNRSCAADIAVNACRVADKVLFGTWAVKVSVLAVLNVVRSAGEVFVYLSTLQPL